MSARDVVGELWRQDVSGKSSFNNNLSALYRGVMPAMTKEFLKSVVYKGVLITGAPSLAAAAIPDYVQESIPSYQYHFIKAVIAGSIAGVGDVAFGGAFESWATFSATAQGANSKASFFNQVSEGKTVLDKVGKLYQGAVPSMVKGTVAFSTFFYTATPIKSAVAGYFNNEPGAKTPWYGTLLAAVLSGGAVALTSSPFDIAKTQAQMPNASKKSLGQALKSNFQSYGWRGLTAGLPLKTCMVAAGWSIAFFATQRDEKVVNEPMDRVFNKN
tara:strand:- start:471 stop:1286 length:816 start_codon:yes stop_codon:yes gene_type:complete